MNIDQLKATLSNRGGVAVANRFRVFIHPPAALNLGSNSQDLNVLCESCSLPGRQITTFDYQLLQHSFKIPNGFINEDVTLNFILTNDFFAKTVFDSWAALTVDFARYKVKYLEEYRGTIEIYQLAKGGEGIKNPSKGVDYDEYVGGMILIDAFPTTLSSIALDNNSENTVQRYSVTIAYKNFELINV